MSMNYLALDEYIILVDDESLSKLTPAQLMQWLRSQNVSFKGLLMHKLIEKWQQFKLILKLSKDELLKKLQAHDLSLDGSNVDLIILFSKRFR